jgi:hypothetical protein
MIFAYTTMLLIGKELAKSMEQATGNRQQETEKAKPKPKPKPNSKNPGRRQLLDPVGRVD